MSDRRWLRWLTAGLAAVVAAGFLAALTIVVMLFQPFRIPSESMQPALEVGDRIVVRRGGDFDLGDIVVLHPPADALDGGCGVLRPADAMCARPAPDFAEVSFVQRVVAGPGDRVALRGGRLVRNGRPLPERYAVGCSGATTCDFPRTVTVPRGHYLTLGDNRGQSSDSRFWGPVPRRAILGPVVLRYWPPARVGSP